MVFVGTRVYLNILVYYIYNIKIGPTLDGLVNNAFVYRGYITKSNETRPNWEFSRDYNIINNFSIMLA